MATELTLNGDISCGAIAATGNVVGNVVNAVGNVQGANGVFSNDVSGATGTFSAGVRNSYFKITPEGGFAVRLTNESGAVTVKGQIVSHKETVARAFDLTAVDANHCLGVVYESGIADAAECWVVVAGIAQVLMKNAATMGHICRIPLNTDDGEAAGYAMDASQSSTASVYKIGDVLETADAEVLCKVLLH
jgi:hypothetical protein